MMQKEQFLQILKKYREGKASDGEKAFLLAYYNLFEAEPDVLESLSPAEKDQLKSGIRRDIRRRAGLHEPAGAVSRKMTRWVSIAASVTVFLLIAIGVYFRINKQQADHRTHSSAKNDIAPGSNKALLTLSDGTQVVLDTVRNGVFTYQDGVNISKRANGQLVYDLPGGPENNEPPGFNRIETPTGGQYQVILPDGSKAWLNAKSSIRFPVSFGDDYRQVEMTGEVYFEVSRNEKKPFKVLVKAAGRDEVAINVLGTHFNVMAYEDETAVKTTLLEGSIEIETGNQATDNKKLLKPGQQARIGQDADAIRVFEVNPEEAVAWKNGYFLFANEDLQSIMRKIARWYDVDIEYQGKIPQKVFGGTVSKFENVSEVLNMLELTGSVHFKIEGRRIIVMP